MERQLIGDYQRTGDGYTNPVSVAQRERDADGEPDGIGYSLAVTNAERITNSKRDADGEPDSIGYSLTDAYGERNADFYDYRNGNAVTDAYGHVRDILEPVVIQCN